MQTVWAESKKHGRKRGLGCKGQSANRWAHGDISKLHCWQYFSCCSPVPVALA